MTKRSQMRFCALIALLPFAIANDIPAAFGAEPTPMISAMSHKEFSAVIEACALGILFSPDIAEPKVFLNPIGWSQVSPSDREWFLSLETESAATWSAYQAGDGRSSSHEEIWNQSSKDAKQQYVKAVPEGNVFRSTSNAMLRIFQEQKDCILFTGSGPEELSAYQALPEQIEETASSPFLRARIDPDTTSGIYEANQLNTQQLSTYFGTTFQLKHVFLIKSER